MRHSLTEYFFGLCFRNGQAKIPRSSEVSGIIEAFWKRLNPLPLLSSWLLSSPLSRGRFALELVVVLGRPGRDVVEPP